MGKVLARAITLSLWLIAVTASTALAQAALDHRQLTRWCNSKHSDSYRRMACEGDGAAYHRSWQNLRSGHNARTTRLLDIAMEHCRTRWVPDWQAIMICSESQLGEAMRLGEINSQAGMATVDACLAKYGPRLTLVEACTSTSLKQ